ncbi:MAG: rhodanese-like domain-containing protein [Ginsengibacter sp.]
MKTSVVFSLLASVLILFAFQQCKAQEPKPENWTSEQLMQPADLAQALNDNKNIPLIYCVGPGVVIPHSIDIGMTDKPENIQKLKDSLKKVSRDANIVIYCGCCPFARCPNVRPAIALLKEMKFTNYHLLNLPHNIRTDWISKGYPQVSK